MLDPTLSIALTGAAVGIITKLLAIWERQRERAERSADRNATAVALKAEADRVEKVTHAQTGEVLIRIQEVSAGLEQNTQVNVKALDAGNNFNAKIDKVHTRIDAVVDDINATVKPMKAAITKIQQQLS